MCYPTVIQSQQDLIDLLFIWEMFFTWIREVKNLEKEKSSQYLDLLLIIASTPHVWFIKVSPLERAGKWGLHKHKAGHTLEGNVNTLFYLFIVLDCFQSSFL